MSAVAPTTDRPVTLPDGRVLMLHEAGDPDGVPVVAHHGTPEAGTVFGRAAPRAEARGLRLITYARAGYGGSTRHAGRAWPTWPPTSRPRSTRSASATSSPGASRAAARTRWRCAALLPDRVRGRGRIAGVAP